MDIFKGLIWYAYKENPVQWHQLKVEQANEIIQINSSKKKVASLEAYASEFVDEKEDLIFSDLVGQDSLTRFDKKNKKRRRNRKQKRKKNRNNA